MARSSGVIGTYTISLFDEFPKDFPHEIAPAQTASLRKPLRRRRSGLCPRGRSERTETLLQPFARFR